VSFYSPKRRLTRQRSGNKVSGTTTGGECKIVKTKGINVNDDNIEFNFDKNVSLTKSFDDDFGFVAFGGYIHTQTDFDVELTITFESAGQKFSESNVVQLLGNRWNKIGIHKIFDISSISLQGMLHVLLKIKSNDSLSRIDFFGIELNSVDYYDTSEFFVPFHQQTRIYLPEIYYFEPIEVFHIKPNEYSRFNWTENSCIYLKSCNRCARYLPIDFDLQENDISFSLHCRSRAPCTHSTFATYKVKQNDCTVDTNSDNQIQAYYGYQLECKSCKKFYVNWPLNPLRNSTQHREDSLRRRAFEELVGKLFDKKWIFHTFRLENQTEFDNYIFKKFDKKCFKCKTPLSSRNDMALDHTFPLAMLWPLDETATCLCTSCNSSKSNKFPVDFYNDDELKQLSKLTGLDLSLLKSRHVNIEALEKLRNVVVWFFEKFLMQKDYQKIRDGKISADNIYRSLEDVIKQSEMKLDLIEEYENIQHKKPVSITLN
jgi:hypothetical protein